MQLQLLQKQLDEQLSKQPVGNQEVMLGADLRLSSQDLQAWALLLGTLSPFTPCPLAQGQSFVLNVTLNETWRDRALFVTFFCSCDFSSCRWKTSSGRWIRRREKSSH